jgi:predicted metal-dependent peptidase
MTLKERMVKARIKLMRKHPFFGTLLLNSPWREEPSIPTAATDGNGLLFNPEWCENLSENEFSGVLTHEVLHVALQHVKRMKDHFQVDPFTANIAADIVVNGICDDNDLTLPKDAVRDNNLKHLSVREIYNILKQNQSKDKNHLMKKYGVSAVNECLVSPKGDDDKGQSSEDNSDVNWKDVLNQAATISKMKNAGIRGAGLARILKDLLDPSIDWRTLLYKYLTEYPTDFDGYDRRFIDQNLYIDDFSGTTIKANIYVDTSGSVDNKILREFLSEVQGAINSTNHITGEIYTFDTKVYHICSVSDLDPNNFKALGGGGTSFHPIFELMENPDEASTAFSKHLHIILTDGYANLDLPVPPANASVLWAISPGGVDSDAMPHGEAVRINL